MIKNQNEILLNRKEAAEMLGVREGTLAVWSATERYNLPIVKVGRLVKYRYCDLIDFINKQTYGKGGGNE